METEEFKLNTPLSTLLCLMRQLAIPSSSVCFSLLLGLLSMNPEIIAEAQLPGWVEAVLNQLNTLQAFG
jgi:hypothetical protein